MSDRSYFPAEPDIELTGEAQSAFHERAAAVTREEFGNKVFVRGVVEVSNYCRENCAYCGMRRDNKDLVRYRANYSQIAEMLIQHRPATITDINIQTGEDPVAVREVVLPLIQTLRRETNLGISVCLGTFGPEIYAELKSAGASIYIMKFETANSKRYSALEAPGSLDERVRHIRQIAADGWNVSSGFIAGLAGQTPRELLGNLRLAAALPLAGCSVSPFIPGEDTPLAGDIGAPIHWTLNCMAAMRLMRPDWIIPAVSALNLAGLDGYRQGLRAGANLVTMNLTPTDMRDDYVIYKRDRFIMTEDRVLNAIAAERLTASSEGLAEHYQHKQHLAGLLAAAV